MWGRWLVGAEGGVGRWVCAGREGKEEGGGGGGGGGTSGGGEELGEERGMGKVKLEV